MPNTIMDQITHILTQIAPVIQGAAKTTWSALVNMRRFESITALITDLFGVIFWGAVMLAILYTGYRFIKWVFSFDDFDDERIGQSLFSAIAGGITLAIVCAWPGPNLSTNLQGLGDQGLWMGAIAPELSIVHDAYHKVIGAQGQ